MASDVSYSCRNLFRISKKTQYSADQEKMARLSLEDYDSQEDKTGHFSEKQTKVNKGT